MKLPILIAMVLYMAMVIWIGVIYSKKTKTSEDYFLGGRGLGPWVTAMSAEASDMSSWLLMGLPGLAYATGFSQAGWTAIGLILGTYLNWKIVAKRLRHYTEVADNAITVPDFFSNRFKDDKKILSSISAIMILIFFTVYTASGFAACGTLFNSVFGLNYQKSMIVCAIVIVLYTSMGGFLAASTTDLIQGLLMSFAIVIVLIVGVVNAGGVANVIAHGQAIEGFFDVMKYHDPATGGAVSQGVIPILSGLAWGLGYFGMPHILVRFMAVRDEKELAKSKKVAIVWVLISLVLACVIGVLGRAYLYPMVLSNEGAQYENVYIEMIKKLFMTDYTLPFIGGLLLCGILAAIMSTADSQLLVSSSAVANDLFKGVFFKKLKDKQILFIARATVFVVAIIAIVIAWNPNSSIMNLVSDAWAGLGSAFGPAILMSLYWKRMNLAGAAAGMASGGLTVIIWDYIKCCTLDGVHVTPATYTGVYSLLVGFIVSLVFIVVVSLATPKASDEIMQEFEDVKNGNINA